MSFMDIIRVWRVLSFAYRMSRMSRINLVWLKCSMRTMMKFDRKRDSRSESERWKIRLEFRKCKHFLHWCIFFYANIKNVIDEFFSMQKIAKVEEKKYFLKKCPADEKLVHMPIYFDRMQNHRIPIATKKTKNYPNQNRHRINNSGVFCVLSLTLFASMTGLNPCDKHRN